MEDLPNEATANPMPSPLDEWPFNDWLLDDFKGLWMYEDDQDIRQRVDRLFELLYKARHVFEYVHYDPSDVQREACRNLFYKADAILEHSSLDDVGSVIDRAHQICDIPRDFPDAEVFAALAIRKIFWALTWICDICKAFQEELKPYIEPLSTMRKEFPETYFKEEEKLRVKSWWLERNKIADATEYSGEAELLLTLSAISRDGVISAVVQNYVRQRLRDEANDRSAAGGYKRRGKMEPHTAALRELADAWNIETTKAFRARLKTEAAKMTDGEFTDAKSGHAFWLAKDDPLEVVYQLANGTKGRVSSEALKKLFSRLRADKPQPLDPNSPWALFK